MYDYPDERLPDHAFDKTGQWLQLKFPLWAYLTQPVFSPAFKSLNPFRFWQLHNLEQLETAWLKDSQPGLDDASAWIERLESCWTTSEGDTTEIDSDLSDITELGAIDSLESFGSDLWRDREMLRLLERCWNQSVGYPHRFDSSAEHPDRSRDEPEDS